MDTRSKLLFPEFMHHVSGTCDRNLLLFRDDLDRLCFLSQLANVICEVDWDMYCWCLMDNQFHFIIDAPDSGRAFGLDRLLSQYSAQYHQRHRYSGHRLDIRYATVPIKNSRQFRTLFRSILRTPVEAHLVERVQDWRWNSYQAIILGHSSRVPLRLQKIWSTFGATPNHARAIISRYINESIPSESVIP